MNKLIFINTFRFIALVLLQVLVLNKINLFGHLNPMAYIVWVFLFPIRKNKTTFLLLSFLLGLTIDFFSDSGGIHAASTLFIAFYRLSILKFILGKSDFDYLLFNLRSIVFSKALFYIAISTLVHHTLVFSLEYFSLNDFTTIIYNTFLTSIFTIFIILLGIIFFTKKK